MLETEAHLVRLLRSSHIGNEPGAERKDTPSDPSSFPLVPAIISSPIHSGPLAMNIPPTPYGFPSQPNQVSIECGENLIDNVRITDTEAVPLLGLFLGGLQTHTKYTFTLRFDPSFICKSTTVGLYKVDEEDRVAAVEHDKDGISIEKGMVTLRLRFPESANKDNDWELRFHLGGFRSHSPHVHETLIAKLPVLILSREKWAVEQAIELLRKDKNLTAREAYRQSKAQRRPEKKRKAFGSSQMEPTVTSLSSAGSSPLTSPQSSPIISPAPGSVQFLSPRSSAMEIYGQNFTPPASDTAFVVNNTVEFTSMHGGYDRPHVVTAASFTTETDHVHATGNPFMPFLHGANPFGLFPPSVPATPIQPANSHTQLTFHEVSFPSLPPTPSLPPPLAPVTRTAPTQIPPQLQAQPETPIQPSFHSDDPASIGWEMYRQHVIPKMRFPDKRGSPMAYEMQWLAETVTKVGTTGHLETFFKELGTLVELLGPLYEKRIVIGLCSGDCAAEAVNSLQVDGGFIVRFSCRTDTPELVLTFRKGGKDSSCKLDPPTRNVAGVVKRLLTSERCQYWIEPGTREVRQKTDLRLKEFEDYSSYLESSTSASSSSTSPL